MDRKEIIQNLLGIKSYLATESCKHDKIAREAFMESIRTIDNAIVMLKENEYFTCEKCGLEFVTVVCPRCGHEQ